MAPHHKPPHVPPHVSPHHRVPSSDIASFIHPTEIDEALVPFLPDPGDRGLVVRCLLDLGPAHHRGANYVLLRLLCEVLARLGPPALAPIPAADGAPIPMRLPPSLPVQSEETEFPLRLPTRPLERLVPRGSRDFIAMIDCLSDGPPQHSLGNAAMLCLLDAILARLPQTPERGP